MSFIGQTFTLKKQVQLLLSVGLVFGLTACGEPNAKLGGSKSCKSDHNPIPMKGDKLTGDKIQVLNTKSTIEKKDSLPTGKYQLEAVRMYFQEKGDPIPGSKRPNILAADIVVNQVSKGKQKGKWVYDYRCNRVRKGQSFTQEGFVVAGSFSVENNKEKSTITPADIGELSLVRPTDKHVINVFVSSGNATGMDNLEKVYKVEGGDFVTVKTSGDNKTRFQVRSHFKEGKRHVWYAATYVYYKDPVKAPKSKAFIPSSLVGQLTSPENIKSKD